MWVVDLDAILVRAISADNQGNLLIGGEFVSSTAIDFDPGPAVFPLAALGTSDIFVLKLDSSGSMTWVKQIGSIQHDYLHDLGIDHQDNVIYSGKFNTSNVNMVMDFDPGPDTSYLSSFNNTADYFISKLDSNGDFMWAKNIAGDDHEYLSAKLAIDSFDNVFLSGTFSGKADFDPGPDTSYLSAPFNGVFNMNTAFIQKLNPQGDFMWARMVGEPIYYGSYVNNSQITIDPSGFVYIAGPFKHIVDFDPGPGVDSLWSINVSNTYITKFSPSGDYNYVKRIVENPLNVNHKELLSSLIIDENFNMYLMGDLYISADFDPDTSVYQLSTPTVSSDIFLAKWRQEGGCSRFAIQVDSLEEVSCQLPGYISTLTVGGTAPYSYSWENNPVLTDSFLSTNQTGFYGIKVIDAEGCKDSVKVLLNGPSTQTGSDLRVNVVSGEYRPGRRTNIWVDAFNAGCTPINGTLIFTMDPLLSLVSIHPVPDSVSGNRYFWDVQGMNVEDPHFTVNIEANVSLAAVIGDQICNQAVIYRKGNTGTNTKFNDRGYCKDVVNSYDPNDKQVYPKGLCEEGFIENGEILTYTLRFQNTGNASAIDIFLLDTLDVNLDLNTVRVLGQSHEPMITELLPGRVLKFRFDNIYLPDSITDEKNSHGYVIFEVAPHTALAVGTELRNRTGIYFDFNDPVITNTVSNTITDVLPGLDTVYLNESGCNSFSLNKRTYTRSGTFLQQLEGTDACDSIIVLNLSLDFIDTTVSLVEKTLTAHEGDVHGQGVSYQWVDCDNNHAPIPGATQKSFQPDRNGKYAVIIQRDSCEALSACTEVMILRINPDFQASLRYYPNPSKGGVTVDLGAFYQTVQITSINILGQEVGAEYLNGLRQASIQLPEQRGVYFLQIIADGKKGMIKVLRL